MADPLPWRGDGKNNAARAAQVIRVNPGDDIATICGRVDIAPTQSVILHIPHGSEALSGELGMHRLGHFARESGKSIAIATQSPAIAMHARRARLPVTRNPARVRWNTGPKYIPMAGRAMRVPGGGGILRGTGILGLVVIVGALLLSAAPQGSVTLAPASTTLTRTVEVTASPDRDDLSLDEMALPAREVSSRHSMTLAIPTTGTALVGVERARVDVAITNPGEAAVTVPRGSVLLAGPEYLPFLVSAETSVPAGATVTQLAVAKALGAQWNVPAKVGWGWLDEGLRALTVVNAAPAAGGKSVERPGVGAADIQRALDQVRALGHADSVRERLLQDYPNDLVLLRTAFVSVDHEDLPKAGTEGDVLLLDVEVTVRALAVLAPVLEQVAAETLPLGEHNATLVAGSVLAREEAPQPYLGGEGLVRTKVVLSGQVVENFSKDDVKELIKGKSASLAQTVLTERYQAARAEVTNWPSWAPFLPRFDFRLRVNVVPSEQSEAAKAD